MIRTMRAVRRAAAAADRRAGRGNPASGAGHAGVVGMIYGYLIAAALLPDVARRACRRAYTARSIGGHLASLVGLVDMGLGMAMLEALAASAARSAPGCAAPRARGGAPGSLAPSPAPAAPRGRDCSLPGTSPSRSSPILQGRGLVAGFVIIACILLGAALSLPLVFAASCARESKAQTMRSPSGSGPTAASSSRACRSR